MKKLWALAFNVLLEAIRNKIFVGVVLTALAVQWASILLGELTVGEEVRLVTDSALAVVSFFGVVLAIILGVTLLYQELEQRTIYVMLAKPLERWQFILGKYLGMAVVLMAQVLVTGLGAVLLILVVGGSPNIELFKALLLIAGEVLLVCAIATLFSAFSTPVVSGLLTFGVFVLGRLTEEVLAFGEATDLSGLDAIFGALTYLLPNLHLFTVSGREIAGQWLSVHGTFVTWGYVGATLAYGAAYATVMLGLSVLVFSRREFN